MDLQVKVDSGRLDVMLLRLDVGLSGPALAVFLTGTVDPFLRRRAGQRFRNEGDDAVGPWLALSSGTEHIRELQGYGPAHPINKRTGLLEDYILNTPSKTFFVGNTSSLRYPGTNATGQMGKKVLTAQKGAPPQGHYRATPPRPVLGLGPTDYAFILGTMSRYLKTVVGM